MSMWSLARSTIRMYRASFAGTFAVIVLASALLAGVGVLMESGLRGGVEPQRFRYVDVVVTAPEPSGITIGVGAVQRPPLDGDVVSAVEAVPGVSRAAAEVTIPLSTDDGSLVSAHTWGLIALRDDALVSGTTPDHAGDVVLDTSLDYGVGDQVVLLHGAVPTTYTVVGLVDRPEPSHRPFDVYLSNGDVAGLRPQGNEQVTAIGVLVDQGVSSPEVADRISDQVADVATFTGEAKGDAEFPDSSAGAAGLLTVAGSFFGTASVIVVFIVASTLALSIRQRRAQFALLRAIGATPAQLRAGIVRELLLVSAIAAPLGAVPGLFAALLLKPTLVSSGIMPADFDLVLSPFPAVAACLAIITVSVLAALIAARRPARVAPADALREAAVEEPTIGRVRSIAAIVTGVAGLAAAFTPIFIPGVIGGATAAMSAILLICAVALAGPPIVVWLLDRSAPLLGRSKAAAVRLAAANSRGFSRRLTAAIVPLALALSFGVVQSFVNSTIATAAQTQLQDGIRADIVVTAPAGIAPSLTAEVEATPGVRAAAPLFAATASIVTDSAQDNPFGSEPIRESSPLRSVPPDIPTSLLDLDLTEGDLAGLTGADTVAVSSDLAFENLLGVGDTVELRYEDGEEVSAEVVAVYERGLGFGNLTVSQDTLTEHSNDALADTVLVQADATDVAAVTAAIRPLGLEVVDTHEYVAANVSAGDPTQQLSMVLLLALLAFIALAALNTLAMATAERRDEFVLLQRVGATRGQLVRTTAIEAGITAVAALAIGTLPVLPAAVGVGLGLTATVIPSIDGAIFAGLAATVVVVSFAGTTLVGAVVSRSVVRAAAAARG